MIERSFFDAETLTNVLYALAQLGHPPGNYLNSAVRKFLSSQELDYTMAARNLWNFYALDYKSVELLELCTRVLL